MTDALSENAAFRTVVCETPEATFELGAKLGATLAGGELILLGGGLGAGKTLFTKGLLAALDFDPDEVNSPSFTLVNLYRTPHLDVYHLDLWRIDAAHDAAAAVGLPEILEDETAVTIVEWPERLRDFEFPARTLAVRIRGDGDGPREIAIGALHSAAEDLS